MEECLHCLSLFFSFNEKPVHTDTRELMSQDHLVGILRHAYTTNDNGMHELVQGLDEGEKGILRGVLTF